VSTSVLATLVVPESSLEEVTPAHYSSQKIPKELTIFNQEEKHKERYCGG